MWTLVKFTLSIVVLIAALYGLMTDGISLAAYWSMLNFSMIILYNS